VTYGYDDITVQQCWAAARLGRAIADRWEFRLPTRTALELLSRRLSAGAAD